VVFAWPTEPLAVASISALLVTSSCLWALGLEPCAIMLPITRRKENLVVEKEWSQRQQEAWDKMEQLRQEYETV
jgi:hypothetical protein